MNGKTIRDYLVALAVTLVSGIPFLVTEGLGIRIYFYFLVFIATFILLTIWNEIGDYIAIHYILRGDAMQNEADIAPCLKEFIISKKRADECKLFYTQSSTPYFIPVGDNAVVVSAGIEQYIIAGGTAYLEKAVSPSIFESNNIISTKIVLISLTIIPIMRWIIQLFTTLIIRGAQILIGLVVALATGSLFESLGTFFDSYALGRMLGVLLTKIYELTNIIQDKIVDLIIDFTQTMAFKHVEDSNSVL